MQLMLNLHLLKTSMLSTRVYYDLYGKGSLRSST